MIYAFNDYIPVVHPSAFVHPQANVTGNVIIGADVYIGPGAVLRGDWGQIIIEDGCNVQENCVLHTDMGYPLAIGPNCTIGHKAMLHGCVIEDGCLIGMGATLLNGARIGAGSLIGACALVTEGKEIAPGSLVMGSPGKVVRALDEAARERLLASAAGYRANAARFAAGLTAV